MCCTVASPAESGSARWIVLFEPAASDDTGLAAWTITASLPLKSSEKVGSEEPLQENPPSN